MGVADYGGLDCWGELSEESLQVCWVRGSIVSKISNHPYLIPFQATFVYPSLGLSEINQQWENGEVYDALENVKRHAMKFGFFNRESDQRKFAKLPFPPEVVEAMDDF